MHSQEAKKTLVPLLIIRSLVIGFLAGAGAVLGALGAVAVAFIIKKIKTTIIPKSPEDKLREITEVSGKITEANQAIAVIEDVRTEIIEQMKITKEEIPSKLSYEAKMHNVTIMGSLYADFLRLGSELAEQRSILEKAEKKKEELEKPELVNVIKNFWSNGFNSLKGRIGFIFSNPFKGRKEENIEELALASSTSSTDHPAAELAAPAPGLLFSATTDSNNNSPTIGKATKKRKRSQF